MKKEQFDKEVKDLLRDVVEGFVIHTDVFRIVMEPRDDHTKMMLFVHDNDMPKILGKKGITFQSLSYLFRYIYFEWDFSLTLHLEKLEDVEAEPVMPASPTMDDWSSEHINDIVDGLCGFLFYTYEIEFKSDGERVDMTIYYGDEEDKDVVAKVGPSFDKIVHVIGRKEGVRIETHFVFRNESSSNRR